MPEDKGFSRRQILAGLGSLPIVTAGTMPAAAATSSSARIEISGNRFTLEGHTLRLTGIAVGDPLYIRAKRPASDYRRIATEWFANCVRISAFPGHWRADPQGTGAALDREISLARAEGLFVIIDWHAIGFPGYYEPLVPADWGLPRDIHLSTLDEASAFWATMSARYSSDPHILFELWNEPVADGHLWTATGQHWPIFRAAWGDMIKTIRQNADNIVLCAGGYWSHDLVGVRANLMADPRTAYVWHSYPNAERGDFKARLATLDRLYEVKPIVVTEWGFCPECTDDLRGTVEDFGRPFVDDFLNKYQLSHTAWCFSRGATPNLLGPGDIPSAFGRFVQATLKQSGTSGDGIIRE